MRVRRLKPLIVATALHALEVLQEGLDLPRHRVRSLQRGRVGELHVHEQEALVFVRDEPRRQPASEATGEDGEAGQDHEAQGRLADEPVRQVHVAVRRPREAAVEGAEEPSEEPTRLAPRPQQQGRKGRAKG